MQRITKILDYKGHIFITLVSTFIALALVIEPLFAFLIVTLILLSMLAIPNWDKIVWFVVPAFYLGFSIYTWPLGDIGFKFPVLTILTIPAIFHILAFAINKKVREISLNWTLILLIVTLIGYIFLSLLWTQNYEYGVKKTNIFITQAAVPALILLTTKFQSNSIRHFGLALQLIGGLTAIQLFFLGTEDVRYPGRTVLPGTNPIWLSRVAVIAIIVSMWNLSSFSGARKFIINAMAILSSSYVIYVSASRGPIIAFIVGAILGILISFLGKKDLKSTIKISVIMATIFIILSSPIIIHPEIPARHIDILLDPTSLRFDDNFISRMQFSQKALSLFSENPLLGKGIGGYSAFERDYPHNLILEILAENGIIGMLLFSAIIINILSRLRFKDKFITEKITLFLTPFLFALCSGDLSSNYEWLVIGAFINRWASHKEA